jgi:hypothetical protein
VCVCVCVYVCVCECVCVRVCVCVSFLPRTNTIKDWFVTCKLPELSYSLSDEIPDSLSTVTKEQGLKKDPCLVSELSAVNRVMTMRTFWGHHQKYLSQNGSACEPLQDSG